MELIKYPTLGILRLDYDYPAAPGDIDCPQSFDYPVVYHVVPGLTFQMAQSGVLTPEVEQEFDEAILWLANERKVSAITGDCGFMMWFQARARQLTSTPIFLSALLQLPTISATLSKNNDKIIILTANNTSLQPMQGLINEISGVKEEQMHFAYVGCQDIPHFGYEVEHGLQVDVSKAEPGILAQVQTALQIYPKARAILLECTELPPYADAIRAETGLPVYDAITNADFVMKAFLDNARFGREQWYTSWSGKQESYYLSKYLTEAQRKKLVSKAADDDCVDAHHMEKIVKELNKTDLQQELTDMGYMITNEQVAHAIAKQAENHMMDEMKEEIKMRKKRRFEKVRSFLKYMNERKYIKRKVQSTLG